MVEKYINYYNKFRELDNEDKKKEIVEHFKELILLLYKMNKNIDDNNEILPVLDKYEDDDEFLNLMFTYIITLKEENSKLIDYIMKS